MYICLFLKEIEEEDDSGCEGEGQILTPPSSPESGQGHSNSSHSSSGSSMLDVHNLNLHGTGGRSAIVRVTAGNGQGVARYKKNNIFFYTFKNFLDTFLL